MHNFNVLMELKKEGFSFLGCIASSSMKGGFGINVSDELMSLIGFSFFWFLLMSRLSSFLEAGLSHGALFFSFE